LVVGWVRPLEVAHGVCLQLGVAGVLECVHVQLVDVELVVDVDVAVLIALAAGLDHLARERHRHRLVPQPFA